MMRVENASKQYRRGSESVLALDQVSFEVERGRLALLRGASGSGKTTLINLCAGLASPTSGRIFVGDKCVSDMSRSERAALRAHTVAVVFQLFHLTPYLSALENILLPTLATSIPDAGARARALMEELGY